MAFCGQCGAKIVRDRLVGTVLDNRYRIETKIAAGGFGTIYRATSLDDGEEVAIKVLHAQHNNDPLVSARFRREAVAMASFSDPHTVTTYELGEDDDGTRFIVMELLHGESLADRFARTGALHWRSVLGIVRQTCSSLAEAHALGIVHRDLKPANVYLSNEPEPDFVKVLDFGIAKIVHGSNMHDGRDITRIGQAIGTLEYMSPEQLVGGELDKRTDIYTLGVVAYEMITGRRPFADVTGATGLVTALMTRKPAPPSTIARGPLPPSLDGILLRCLERDSPDRYGDIVELADAIDRLLALESDILTTQRQWGKPSPRVRPVFVEVDDELTWIDARSPFDDSIALVARADTAREDIDAPTVAEKPPILRDLVAASPGSAGGSTVKRCEVEIDMTPIEKIEKIDDHVLRAQIMPPLPPVVPATSVLAPDTNPVTPRSWRVLGTGVPFEELPSIDSIESSGGGMFGNEPTVTKTATPRSLLAVGSSPIITDEPAVRLPTAPSTPVARVVLYAILLTAMGLGIGMVIASLAM